MHDDVDRSDGERLWDEAWSRRGIPAEEPPRAREQWRPGVKRDGRDPAGDLSRSRRRIVEVGGRDAHLTFEPPDQHRPAPREPRAAGRDRARAARGERYRVPAQRGGARSLAPRRSVVDYRRGRGALLTAVLLAAVAVVASVGGGLAWWLLTRPAALTITPSPADALITIPGHGSRTGRFSLDEVEPGVVTATVARSGFESTTVAITAERGRRVDRAVALTPRSFRLKLAVRPAGATMALKRADGSILRHAAPYSILTTAGPLSVTISKSGYNSFTQSLYLDGPRTVDVQLDPKGQLVHSLGSLSAKGAPKSVAVSPDGREAWAAILNGPPSIQIYDLKTMLKVGRVDLGKYGAVEVIFNRAGTRAYASQMETAKVFEIDTATRKVTRSFKTKSAWTKVVALSPNEKTLYAANWSGNDVSVIDLVSGALKKRIPVAKTPRGLWPTADGRYLFVAGFANGDLQRVDLKKWSVRNVFRSGGAMRHLVADEGTGKLYGSDMAKDVVWVTDMKTLRTTRFCKTDEKPNTIELSPDGRVLFISNRGENNPKSYYIPGYEWGTILLMSTATGKALDAIVGGNQCTALDVSADGRTLVFSDFLDDRLRVYSVPVYETLAAGNGGRFAAHFADLKKSRP